MAARSGGDELRRQVEVAARQLSIGASPDLHQVPEPSAARKVWCRRQLAGCRPPRRYGAGRWRAVVSALAVVAHVTLGASVAAADCGGSSVTVDPEEATRGQTIRIAGAGFGDQCYDNPDYEYPEGEGILGRPVSGLELVIVQGSQSVVLATGNADASYRFRAVVTVPHDLQPGLANILVRGMEPTSAPQTGLTITDEPAMGTGTRLTTTFGPDEPAVIGQRDPLWTRPVVILGLVVVAAVIGSRIWNAARRRQQHHRT